MPVDPIKVGQTSSAAKNCRFLEEPAPPSIPPGNGSLHDHTDGFQSAPRDKSSGQSKPGEHPRILFDFAPIAYVTLDKYGLITEANRAAGDLFGVDRHSLVGLRFADFVAPESKNTYYMHYRRLLKSSERDRCSVTVIPPNRAAFHAELDGLAVKDRENSSHLMTIREIGHAENDLIESRAAVTLRNLAGGIAHEIRNPLATVDTSAFFLKSRLRGDDAKGAEHIKRIRSAVERSSKIIQGLLDLAEMRDPWLAVLDLRAVVREAVAGLAPPPGIKAVASFPDQAVLVNADGDQLKTAFSNIMENAVQAMERTGALTIEVKNNGEVMFADTGQGIAPEHMPRLFEPFFTTRARGIGLGLPVARMIVMKHGGSIHAASCPGKGSTFLVTLPLCEGK